MKKTKAVKKQKELFGKSFVKDLESLFRNCDERVAKLVTEKALTGKIENIKP